MGKMISKSIKRMGWKGKALLLCVLTLLVTFGMLEGWYNPPAIQADVVVQQAWGTPLYNGAANPGNLSFTVTTGSKRVLVVAVTSAINAASTTQSCSVTYGGVPLTLAVSDQTSNAQQHSWLFYLPENAIMDGTAKTLAVTTGNGGRTFVNNMVYAAVYSGVDQGSPLVDSKSYNSGATLVSAPAFATALNTAAGGKAVVVANAVRTTATTTTTMTAAANWTLTQTATWTTTYGIRSGVLDRAVPASAVTDTAAVTLQTNRTALASMCGLSLRAAPTTSSLTVSGNTAIATGSRLDSDTGVIMQRMQVAASGDLTLSSLTMENMGTATAIQNAYVYISGSSQTTLPVDAVLLAQVSNWSGLSTPIDLTAIAGTAAARGITAATPKYLYVVVDMAPGQATKTVTTRVTAVGVVSPNIGASALDLRSNIITLNYSGNVAQVTGNTAVAASAKDSDAAVLMQHFQVASDAGFDGALELSSLTIEDLGNVSQVDAVKIYVDTVEQPVLPASAKLIGHITDWNRAKVTIPLVDDFGATSADRTVISGSPKHLYVVYSMNYVDDALWPTTGKVVQSKVSAVGASSPDSGPTGLSLLSNSITLTRGTWSKITSCGGCHATDVSGPNALQDGTARNVPQGLFPGSHGKHLAYGYACSNCHTVPSVYGHANNSVEMGGQVSGSVYSKGASFAVSNTPAMGYCSNLYCHSTGTAVSGAPTAPSQNATWGTPLATCNGCHGGSNTNGLPNYVNGTPRANSHAAHASYNCSTCHYGTTTDGSSIASFGSHANAVYNVGNQAGTISYSMGTVTNGIPAGGTCSSAAGCHGSATWGSTIACSSCHTHATADTDAFGTGVTAMISLSEWTSSGHGRSSSTRYTDQKRGTNLGLFGAGLDEKAGTGQNSCLWCHDSTPQHSYSSANPYRLRNGNALGNGWNDVCLYCHGTGQTGSYKPVATFTTAVNLANVVKIDKWHYQSSTDNSSSYHSSARNGGQLCWDCHDAHGDSNIRMIQLKPVKASATNASGAPVMGTTVATAVSFTNNSLATGAGGWAMTTGSFASGLCNGCHTASASAPKMAHYNATASSGHNSTAVCSSCHTHSADSTRNGKAFAAGTDDCKGCHGTGSTVDVQAEFAKNSHHTNKTWAAITNFDCVVCHAEGYVSGGAVRGDTARHNNPINVVDLYNADNRATIYSINLDNLTLATGTATEKNTANSSLDTFCMSCHDANGAAAVIAGNGFTDGRSATNPFNDGSLTNSYDQQVRSFGAAPAALNVFDQFNTANYSHHAVRGQRYTKTTGLAFGVSLTGAGLLSTTVANSSGGTGMADNSTLHCNDCHSTAWSAHGSANEYLLQTATAANPAAEHTGPTDYVCVKCHVNGSYNGTTGNHVGNASDYVHSSASTGTARITGGNGGHITGIACLNCHDGAVGFGGIHGFPNTTYSAGGSGGTYNKRRFMPGSSLRFYDPSVANTTGTDAGWESATNDNKCYTQSSNTGSMGGCVKHGGGTNANARNTRRPVTY